MSPKIKTGAEEEDRAPAEMTATELAEALKGSLLILTTTSPDKRAIFRTLFTSLGTTDVPDADGKQRAGVDLYFTHSGAVNVVPSKTKEKTKRYDGNLLEKALQQLDTLSDEETERHIRSQLVPGHGLDQEKIQNIRIMGMTEDSGYSLIFDTEAQKNEFIDNVIALIRPSIRERDHDWLVDHLKANDGTADTDDDDRTNAKSAKIDSRFPGVNLHPLQDYLGGFPQLLDVIYKAAEAAGIEKLELKSVSRVSFADPKENRVFQKSFTSYGRLLTRQEYEQRLANTNGHVAVNSDFVQIYDKQVGEEKPNDIMREHVLVSSSEKLPMDYPKRKVVEWLQGLEGLGKREIPEITGAQFDMGFVSPDSRDGQDIHIDIPVIPGLRKVAIPTTQELLSNPNAKFFDDADAVVLIPNGYEKREGELQHDPNMALVMGAIVVGTTDPQSMSKPIILDNRSEKFTPVLRIVQDAFLKGRLLGDLPFFVAETDDDIKRHLETVQSIVRLSPKINKAEPAQRRTSTPKFVPGDDGVFTLFIGGGHENNSKRDLEEANQLGYECAKKGMRIVTGAGSVEGSMGSLHTGFIQYHLDQIHSGNVERVLNDLKARIETKGEEEYDVRELAGQLKKEYITNRQPELAAAIRDFEFSGLIKGMADVRRDTPSYVITYLNYRLKAMHDFKRTIATAEESKGGVTTKKYMRDERYDAEDIILDNPRILDDLAKGGFIPRSMFYGYSMDDLLKLESPSGKQPPAITYFDAGNISRRLQYLLAPGTKVFMPGSVGTDQELEETIAQHLEARMRKQSGAANNSAFADGTPDDNGAIIIYNRDHSLDEVLKHYGLMDDSQPVASDAPRFAERVEKQSISRVKEEHNIIIVDSLEDLQKAVIKRQSSMQEASAQRLM